MLALEVSINDQAPVIACMGEEQLISYMLTIKARSGVDKITSILGGMTEQFDNYEWDTPQLKSGDKVTISIIEVDAHTLEQAKDYKVASGMIDEVKQLLETSKRNQEEENGGENM